MTASGKPSKHSNKDKKRMGYTIPLFGPNVVVNDWDAWRDYWYEKVKHWKLSPELLEKIDKEWDEIFKPKTKK